MSASGSASSAPVPPDDGPAHHGGQEQQQRRWRQLSAVLFNVVRYYRQFEAAVQRQVAAGMAELEKALQVGVCLLRVCVGGAGLVAAAPGTASLPIYQAVSWCLLRPTYPDVVSPCLPLPACLPGLCGSGQVGGPWLLCAQVGWGPGDVKGHGTRRCSATVRSSGLPASSSCMCDVSGCW